MNSISNRILFAIKRNWLLIFLAILVSSMATLARIDYGDRALNYILFVNRHKFYGSMGVLTVFIQPGLLALLAYSIKYPDRHRPSFWIGTKYYALKSIFFLFGCLVLWGTLAAASHVLLNVLEFDIEAHRIADAIAFHLGVLAYSLGAPYIYLYEWKSKDTIVKQLYDLIFIKPKMIPYLFLFVVPIMYTYRLEALNLPSRLERPLGPLVLPMLAVATLLTFMVQCSLLVAEESTE